MASWIAVLLLAATVGGASDCMLVEFSADWCRPCQQMRPALDRLTQEGCVIRHVNVDRESELTQRFRVQSLPTVVVLQGGREVDRLVGATTYEQLVNRIGRARSRHSAAQAASQLQPISNSPAQLNLQQSGQTISTLPPAIPQPTIRGQSPMGIGAFPMLASAASLANLASSASIQPNKNNQFDTNNSIGASSRASETISRSQGILRAQNATVRIRIEDARSQSFGTGTIVDVHGDEVLVLTCGHMFRDMKPEAALTVELFPDGRQISFPAQVIDFEAPDNSQTTSPRPDIGLISFRSSVSVTPAMILPSTQSPTLGQSVFSFGCDRGATPSRRDSQIKHINRYLGPHNIEIAGAPVVGRSGGGLFDQQGRLVGVCNAADNNDDEGIYAGPAVVYSQLERLGLVGLFDGNSRATSTIQLASAAIVGPSHNPALQLNSNQPGLAPNQSIDSHKEWPDQRPENSQVTPFGNLTLSADSPKTSSQAPDSSRQLICIVRDANGQERVVTVDAPSSELLESIDKLAASRAANLK